MVLALLQVFDATIISDSKNEIKISAKGIEIEKVKSEIENGQLVVRIKKKWNDWSSKRTDVTAIITYAQELDEVSSSSGASVHSENSIVSDNLELDASSGASLDVSLQCREVSVDVSSGARVETSGSTTDLIVDMSSGSTYKGYDLSSKNASIEGSSGASAQIHVSNSLEADVSSGASVKYKGNPSNKDVDKSSGGSVRSSGGR
ncbi:MAG: hypothetical protein ACI9FN_004081 [Saprospiraceae bacterium]|jgi:hypothetical protein